MRASAQPCWIELSSPNLAQSQEFFSELFGWEFAGPGPLGLGVTARVDGAAVAGISEQPAEAPAEQPGFWTLYFKVDDFDDFAQDVASHGGNAMMAIPNFDGSASVGLFADPAGAGFGVLSFADDRGFEIQGVPGAPVWYELHTKDMSVTDFYAQVFNWEFGTEPKTGDLPYRVFSIPGNSVPLGGVVDISDTPIPVHWKPYIQVSNVDEIAKKAVELGGAILAQPRTTQFGRVCQFIDVHNAALTVIDPTEKTSD